MNHDEYDYEEDNNEDGNEDYHLGLKIFGQHIRKKYKKIELGIYFYNYDNEIRERALMDMYNLYLSELRDRKFKIKDKYVDISFYLIWDKGNKEENLLLKTISMDSILKPIAEYPKQ